ncbi:MAG: hypothetical protein HQK49_12960 [Oligoflexia bacterium]|nr:hypothetical protein [Oligoflexia bacterium]
MDQLMEQKKRTKKIIQILSNSSDKKDNKLTNSFTVQLFLPLLLFTLFLVSCAKDRPYQEVYKSPETLKKDAIDTNSTFVYVPSTLGAPREISSASPFFQGGEKLVKFKFTKEGLEIFSTEKDEKFKDNPINNTPIITIPATYSDYRCANNSNGECLNKEEENVEIEWSQKRYFKPDLAKLKSSEINALDIFNLDQSCMQEVGSALVDYVINKDVMNIVLEKTYKINNDAQCFYQNVPSRDLDHTSFKVRYVYSFVKLDKLASADYETISYPIDDQKTFGFFASSKTELNANLDSERTNTKYFLHRWNPKRSVIEYYLSDSFNKDGNDLFKKSAYSSIEVINKGLEKSNAGFKIELKEPKSIMPGDLRFNTINLIDEPLANSLLGYGPTVANPNTGEIIHGNVNVYGAAFKQGVRGIYESMVDLSKNKERNDFERFGMSTFSSATSSSGSAGSNGGGKKNPSTKAITNITSTNLNSIFDWDNDSAKKYYREQFFTGEEMNDLISQGNDSNYTWYDLDKLIGINIRSVVNPKNSEYQNILTKIRGKDNDDFSYSNDSIFQKHINNSLFSNKNILAKNANKLKSIQEEENKFLAAATDGALAREGSKVKKISLTEKMLRLGKMNAEPMEFLDYPTMAKSLIPGIRDISNINNSDNSLKGWEELNEDQRKAVTATILPIIFSHTLVHELGHNLGLRHNFKGSFDKANFYNANEIYSKEEIYKNKILAGPAYSSIMDYGYSELNELGILGKYDIAALRFAYAREVIKKNGDVIKVTDNLRDTKKQVEGNLEAKFLELFNKYKPVFDELNKISESMVKLKKDISEADNVLKKKLQEKLTELENKVKEKEKDIIAFKREESNLSKHTFKTYLYCSDDDVGSDISCDQFDEGTTFTEIAHSYNRKYNEGYRHRYLRNDRNDFYEYDIHKSILNSTRMFFKARMIFELYEIASTIFGKKKMAYGCSDDEREKNPNCKMIEDIRGASMLIAKMFLEIIKMPDLTCLVQPMRDKSDGKPEGNHEGKPEEKPKQVSLREFFYGNRLSSEMDHVPTSCFDPKIMQIFKDSKYELLAEGGQYFKSMAEINPKYTNGDYSQIAVRGNWHDKILAMKFLTKRNISMRMDEGGQGSFIDIPDVLMAVSNYILHTTTNTELLDPVLFHNPLTGDQYKVPYVIDNDYVVSDQLSPAIRDYLWLPVGNVPLNKVLLQIAYSSNKTQDVDYKDMADKFTDSLCVYRKDHSDGFSTTTNKFVQTLYNKTFYGAYKNNQIAYALLSKLKDDVEKFNILIENKEDVDKIFMYRFGDKIPLSINLSDEEKKILMNLDLEKLKKILEEVNILNGSEMSEEFAAKLFGKYYKNFVLIASKLGNARLAEVIKHKENTMVGQLPVDKLKKILELIKTLNGQELTMTESKKAIGDIFGGLGIMAYKLGEEKLKELIKLKDTPQENATSTQKYIYSLDMNVLNEFKKGILKNRIDAMWAPLQIMPSCNN